jgi:hypothetical protein
MDFKRLPTVGYANEKFFNSDLDRRSKELNVGIARQQAFHSLLTVTFILSQLP